jgi:hypothetical protein
MEDLATTFEKRVLFGYGRHLWNILGISGTVATVIGGVALLTSPFEKVSSYEDWLRNQKRGDYDAKEILGQIPIVERLKQECFEGSWRCEEDRLRLVQARISRVDARLKGEYQSYASSITERRPAAQLLLGWGLGAVATASVVSSILAIERSVRKD